MAQLQQDKALEVESLVRVYYHDGPFSEPFNKLTLYNLDKNIDATLDVNGPVPLPPGVPIVFDCSTTGKNISNMALQLNGGAGVVCYWTKYRGYIWSMES